MDTGTLLVGILLFAILIIPFIYAIRHQKNKYKKEKEELLVLAKNRNINPDKPEVINDLIMALDTSHRELVISRIQDLEENFSVIELKDFNTFRVLSQTSEFVKLVLINSKDKNKVELLFWEKPGETFPNLDFLTCKEKAQKWGEKLQLIMLQP